MIQPEAIRMTIVDRASASAGICRNQFRMKAPITAMVPTARKANQPLKSRLVFMA
ncbi:hypothetical protein D3C83_154670 [compost metagenome]